MKIFLQIMFGQYKVLYHSWLFALFFHLYLFFFFIFKGQNELKNNGTTYYIYICFFFFFSSFLLSHYAFIALGYRQEIITTILANSNQCKEQNQSVPLCLDFISMYKFTFLHASFNSSISLLNVKTVHKILIYREFYNECYFSKFIVKYREIFNLPE